jgi:hypothetical protein
MTEAAPGRAGAATSGEYHHAEMEYLIVSLGAHAAVAPANTIDATNN